LPGRLRFPPVFLAAQIPIADLRPFVRDDTRKLGRPRFTHGFNVNQPEFLRAFGALAEQEPGLPTDWPSENLYCHAARGLRLQPAVLQALSATVGGPGHFVTAFRRYLSNGGAVGRLELGIDHAPRTARVPPLDAAAVARLVHAAAGLKVDVRAKDAIPRVAFADAGPLLAAQLLSSSTEWSATAPGWRPEAWWIAPGRPLLVVEYAPGEVTALPGDAQPVAIDVPGVTLHFQQLSAAHRGTRVWLAELGPDLTPQALRALRLHLLRLHSEREAIRIVLEAIADQRVPIPPDLPRDDELVLYLEDALGFLERKRVYGHEQSALLRAAYASDETMTGNDRETLLREVGKTYRRIHDRVEAFTEPVSYPLMPVSPRGRRRLFPWKGGA
jgi:hypothetical protein